MKLTYIQTSHLLSVALRGEAKRCVATHGSGGKGDEIGAQFLSACTAEYVQTCVERELTVNPSNKLAQSLRQHYINVLQ